MSWYPGKFVERVLGGYRGQERIEVIKPEYELLVTAEIIKHTLLTVGFPMTQRFGELMRSLSDIKRINEENRFGQDAYVKRLSDELSMLISNYKMISKIVDDVNAILMGIINDMQSRLWW